MVKYVLTEYGYSVSCYGGCNERAIIYMCFNDELYDDFSASSFTNWAEAVKEISQYAHRNKITLQQLESDLS